MAIQQNPQALQNPQIQMQLKMTNDKIEARKAVLIAEMMEEFARRRKENVLLNLTMILLLN